MAIYRNINISFWTDTKVADDFTPEDKYFMLYCLTNPYTNLCGCYEISIKQMSKDLGYDSETIEKLLKRFTDIHKIISYNKSTKELLIKNWHKYNWTRSEKLDKPLLNEIKNIKTPEYQHFVSDLYNKRDTVSIPYLYPMDTTVSVSVTDTVSDTDIDKIKEIISYLNDATGSRYKANTDKTKRTIHARLAEGFTVDDFKAVIDKKNQDWKGTEWEKYLRPETLFGTKFEGYLNQKIKRQANTGVASIKI